MDALAATYEGVPQRKQPLMTRRMSCSMTIPAVRDRSKTVTRRHPDTWTNLQPGDRITLIEKGMGLPKGAHQVVLCEVEIVSNEVQPLGWIGAPCELAAEGLPEMSPIEFMVMWADSHGHRGVRTEELLNLDCRRIEWRYLDLHRRVRRNRDLLLGA